MTTKSILLVAGLAVGGLAVWRWHGSAPAADDIQAPDAKLVRDRLWIDHIPKNERDMIKIFAMLSDESVGVFQNTSAWRGEYDVFRFEMSGDEARLLFPQTGDREKVRARAGKCREAGFDFCLELSGNKHGTKRYYSREGWDLRSSADARMLVDQLEHATTD